MQRRELMKGKDEVLAVVISLRCVVVWCGSLRKGSVFEEVTGRLRVRLDQPTPHE